MPEMERVNREVELPLSFAQQRLWLVDQLHPGKASYNIPICVRLKGKLRVWALQQTLNEVERRHEALRTMFPMVNGKPRQVIRPYRSRMLSIVDLCAIAEQEQEQQMLRLI